MPIYSYQCEKYNHKTEIITSFKDRPSSIGCEICLRYSKENILAYLIPSVPSPPYLAKPTEIFVNKQTGEKQVATSHYDKPPYGFVKEELKGTRERSQFEKEETAKANIVAQVETHKIKEKSNQMRKERHDNMLATMNAKQVDIDVDTGEKIEYHMDSNTQSLLKSAMERSKKKDRIPTKVVEKRLAVNHMDSSNIQDAPK